MSLNDVFFAWLIMVLIVTKTSGLSYNQPKFYPSATWNSSAMVFANIITVGFNNYGLFVDTNNTVYAAATSFSRVQIWFQGNGTSTRQLTNDLSDPRGLFVTSDGDVYVDNGNSNHRVEKWTSNATVGISVMNVTNTCYDLFIDINNILYCSIDSQHKVIKTSLNDTSGTATITAGNGTSGAGSYMLQWPNGIFVDQQLNLYVADCGNNRIQFFRFENLNGTTLKVHGPTGNITLNCPTDVTLDADGYLFITDYGNNRIIGSGSDGFRCIVGCTQLSGTALNKLNGPRYLAFDSYGNLFVSDSGNSRIQKIFLTSNSNTFSWNQPQLCSNASWNPNATTFANEIIVGSQPHGIFVNFNNTVYAASRYDKIIVWPNESNTTTWSISGNLNNSLSIFATVNGDIYVDNGDARHQIDKWTSNATNSVALSNVTSRCWDLFIDIINNLYCSLDLEHQVIKVSLTANSNTMRIAAGNSTPGSGSYMLIFPNGIFVDIKLRLYVADCGNNRIQRFEYGHLDALTIIDNSSANSIILNCPSGIALDADDYLYIVDQFNHRILAQQSNGLRCLVGCSNTPGPTSYQLSSPQKISFDSYGNMFISDMGNNRIQKFFLDINSCVNMTMTSIPSTTLSTAVPMTSLVTTSQQSIQQFFNSFVPSQCPNSSYIGRNCNLSSTQCDVMQPCRNGGTCINTNTTLSDYICSCPPGFDGTNCQFDYRLCQPNTCWNNGLCNELSNTSFICSCSFGWQGVHCEIMLNYCNNIVCLNRGVCRSLFLKYTCECLNDSYSGRYCENVNKKVMIHQIISKSVSSIAIIIIIAFVLFIIIMDVLKYCFGMDLAKNKSKQIHRKKRTKKAKPRTIIRFTYVHSLPTQTLQNTNSTIDQR